MAENPVSKAAAYIEEAYTKLANALPDFVPRAEQKQLSLAIAQNFIEKTPFAAEAPTGTGKTVAYLVGSLAAAEQLRGASGAKPVVVSTGTKALQTQLLTNDLPKLAAAGLLHMNTAVIAKGKNNFFCAQAAEEMLAQNELDLEDLPLYLKEAEEGEERQLLPDEIRPLFDAFEENIWDGDFDNYEGVLPRPLDRIRVNSETCTGKKCPRYSECPYYQMKARMGNASVIVANHDLVTLDLLLVSQDIEPTLPIADYLCVFDEAHQLPDKALKVGSTEANLAGLRIALDKMRFFKKSIWSSMDLISLMDGKGLHEHHFDINVILPYIADLVRACQGFSVDDDTRTRRFARGVVPDQLRALVDQVYNPLQALYVRMSTALGAIHGYSQQEGNTSRKDIAEALYRGVGVARTINEALTGLSSFRDREDVVKWAYITDTKVSLHTSPLEGAAVLKPLLWDASRAQAALVSATLRDLSGFARFQEKSGLPKTAKTMVIPYTFPYGESTLTVANMAATPKPSERKAYIAELVKKIPLHIAQQEATLILFQSRTLLKTLAPYLKDALGETNVLVQGEKPIKQLLSIHTARVDAGRTSVLCGLATMAEGLDLPGDYCRHVMILALPFAVPSDPVEEEIAEILGNRYFGERSLPDAAVRLQQMVGRLLRRESDRGRITIFDRRIVSTNYGLKLLRFLPPFKKVVEKNPVKA